MRYLPILAVAAVLLSCNLMGGETIAGNGKVTTQTRNAAFFNSVEASGSVEVHIRQDSAWGIKIETDENLMEYVEVQNDRNTLVIKPRDGFELEPSKKLIVYTTAPAYRAVSVSGSGGIISDNIISGGEPLEMGVSGSGLINAQVALPRVSASVSGSGDVLLKGTSKEFAGSISGSGSIKAFDLTTDVATLDLSGAAEAEVTANQKLSVEVSGSGDVRYKGAAQVAQRISGAGSVKKVE